MITQLGSKEWLKKFSEASGKLKLIYLNNYILDSKENIKSQYSNQLQIADTIKI